ncbi:MAG: PglZ domain-containing protein [Bacteroidales bacterium]|nr:MAG: PglZ domain-containing protein [Bacteroidales bacterium]
MKQLKILWTDDEIDVLKSHILFLEEKGFIVETANNGNDAIELVKEQEFDLIFLDENMPGLSGLETLKEIKIIAPNIPVIMITKSEEENIMEEAIGSNIDDYLIKPVNPNQILLSIKKNIDQKRLITEKTTSGYQADFARIGMEINSAGNFRDWINIYKKLIYWELELEKSEDSSMAEVYRMQEIQANSEFGKFISSNYLSWFDPDNEEKPLLSPDIFTGRILPLVHRGENVFMILVDNLRFDQWKVIYRTIGDYFRIDREEIYCSILPTATQYSRNAIFAGLMPLEIEQMYPGLWVYDEEETGKNLQERELLENQFKRTGIDVPFFYEKINNLADGKKLVENIPNFSNRPLMIAVYNFVDMLSHARTEMEVLRELANDESAYRSLTLSWFRHSSLLELIKILARQDLTLIITTDHGSIRVRNPVKVVGDRRTSANLRYKLGRNLDYDPKAVFEMKNPNEAYLPKSNISSRYIFATNGDFFAYPQNYNHYVKYYRNTFQHGGISLQEMLIPFVILRPVG